MIDREGVAGGDCCKVSMETCDVSKEGCSPNVKCIAAGNSGAVIPISLPASCCLLGTRGCSLHSCENLLKLLMPFLPLSKVVLVVAMGRTGRTS